MNPLERYPWGQPGTPHTDPKAGVCRFRTVNRIRAVQITNGEYRSAPVSGTFELYKPEQNDPIEVTPRRKKQVQVVCAWYGGRPNKKSGARIDVTSSSCHVKVLDSFSGEVVDDIGPVAGRSPLVATTSLFPDELPAAEQFWEGATRQVVVNAYERDPAARRACIDHFGAVCRVCGFDFAITYGEIGDGFIHVHHARPLSNIRAGYAVDPKRDLVPVCPNCHAMLHQTSPPFTVEELQKHLHSRHADV